MSPAPSFLRTLTTPALAAGAAALVVSMLFAGADRGVSIAIYLAAVGGVLLVQLLRWPGAGWRLDLRPATPLVARSETAVRPARPGALTELEGLLSEGAYSPRAADRRLRPRLIRLAEARLLDRQGIRLHDEPRRARETLGDPCWSLIEPDAPTDRPISPAAIDILVRRLEEL
jgi:hypothetical protein